MTPSNVTACEAPHRRARGQGLPDGRVPRNEPRHDGSRPIRVGFGACAKSGCGCRHYEGWAGTCENAGCRHTIGDHW